MSVIILRSKITNPEIEIVKQEYDFYVKVVVDVANDLLSAGGEWHADGEKILLEAGSLQKNLWGGGVDLNSGLIDYISLINTRPGINNSQEVSDNAIRLKMLEIIKKIFIDYVK